MSTINKKSLAFSLPSILPLPLVYIIINYHHLHYYDKNSQKKKIHPLLKNKQNLHKGQHDLQVQHIQYF